MLITWIHSFLHIKRWIVESWKWNLSKVCTLPLVPGRQRDWSVLSSGLPSAGFLYYLEFKQLPQDIRPPKVLLSTMILKKDTWLRKNRYTVSFWTFPAISFVQTWDKYHNGSLLFFNMETKTFLSEDRCIVNSRDLS